jgi:hypothetical protein
MRSRRHYSTAKLQQCPVFIGLSNSMQPPAMKKETSVRYREFEQAMQIKVATADTVWMAAPPSFVTTLIS